jgi:hypothetical protein
MAVTVSARRGGKPAAVDTGQAFESSVLPGM